LGATVLDDLKAIISAGTPAELERLASDVPLT
jgi:hypothetical protein